MLLRTPRRLHSLIGGAALVVLTTPVGSPVASAAATHVPAPCHRLYYHGAASNPSLLQLRCRRGTVVLTAHGPFPEGQTKHVDQWSHGIQLVGVLLSDGSASMVYRTRDAACVAIRDLRRQSAGGGEFVCVKA